MTAAITETRCPCWRTIYNREAGQQRDITDPHCSFCAGTGRAREFTATTPRSRSWPVRHGGMSHEH